MTDEIIIDEAHRIRSGRVAAILRRWYNRDARFAENATPLLDVHLEDAATLLGITYEEAYARRRERVVQLARNEAKTLTFGARYAKPYTITDFKRYASGEPYLRRWARMVAALGTAPRVVREQDRMVQRPSVLLDNIVWEAFMRDIVVKSR